MKNRMAKADCYMIDIFLPDARGGGVGHVGVNLANSLARCGIR